MVNKLLRSANKTKDIAKISGLVILVHVINILGRQPWGGASYSYIISVRKIWVLRRDTKTEFMVRMPL